jgi:hypothetical protein
MKTLVDGLGYDEIKEQYYTVTYAWKNIVPNQKKSKTTTGKSGITRYDVKTAMSEAVPTRGKQFHQEALWGFECDRKYLPQGISDKQAGDIVQTMDSLFKENMSDGSTGTKGLGTEFYTGPVNEWLDRIKEEWSTALSNAIMRVMGYNHTTDISMVQAMGKQGEVTEQIGEVLNENNKVRSIIPCGYGKSFIMWYGIHKWKQYKDSKFIIYYCHNIPATKQLSVKHSQYSNGGDGFKRMVICSEKKYVNGQVKYGIENYSASETKLSEILEESFKSPERVIFYVNNRSAGEFNEKFKTISQRLKLNITPVSIIDEEQEFTGHKDTDKVDAVVRTISSHQVSFTATENRRGFDTNKDRIYNDDEQYFGVVANEITVSQTISEGRSCPILFKTVEVSDNNSLIREIESNNIIETVFDEETTLSVRGRMLRSAVCLVKSIKEDGRTHPMVVTSLIVNTYSFIRLITNLQQLDIIPKDYVIVRGLRVDGINSAMEFNNHKKAIFIGTPWMVTGTDAPNTDGLIADYDMGSEITGSQWIGRGQRPVDGKGLIVYIPTNPDTTEISTLLRVANKYIQDENVHIESTETNIDETDVEVFGSVQRRNITTQIDRDINANPSLKVYWDKVYNDLTSDVLGRTGEYLKIEYLSFKESRDYVRSLKLKSFKEYQKWSSSGNRPNNILTRPSDIYKDEWCSWWDYLGIVEGWKGYMSYDELVEFIRPFNIQSWKAWFDYWKVNEKPINVPMYPDKTYKEDWVNWSKFLGVQEKFLFVTYEEAEKFALKLKLKNIKEWLLWCKKGERPFNIPASPQNTYLGKGWDSWGKFLGTGVVADVKKTFLPYLQAKKFIHSLKLKNADEWREYSGTIRPSQIPADPQGFYGKTNEWESWGEWLGNGRVSNGNRHSVEFMDKIKSLLREGVTQKEINEKYNIGRDKLWKLNKELKQS